MATKKENLGINETPATLFIGLGGIGSDIIKRLTKLCREGETKNLRFVVFDTNANDLKNIKKGAANITYVQTSSPQSVADYLCHDEQARLHWFPNNTTLYDKTVSEGAGQVRAISRLALNATIKTNEIQKLYKEIDSLFLKDGGDLKQALRVVVVSSSCGGTGSGICMTLGMLVRNYLKEHYREKSIILRGFVLLPGVMETCINTEAELESLRRNGYATIKEINGFMMKASGFCGVRKELERYQDLHVDVPNTATGMTRLEGLPFDFCFLLDRVGQTQEGMLSLDQYKQFAALSLYEQNIGCMQGSAFSMEDNIIKEFSNGDNLGRNRFGGIGAAVLRYPYEDIVDYISYVRIMKRIGNGEEVGAWLKYDKAYETAIKEFKKKRSVSNDKKPEPADVYIDSVDIGKETFDKDIKMYLEKENMSASANTEDRVATYIEDFENEVIYQFESAFAEIKKSVEAVAIYDYKNGLDKSDKPQSIARTNLGKIRNYEKHIKTTAAASAKKTAKGIFNNAPLITSEDVQSFHLESLIKTNDGAMHPNAARYILYTLLKALKAEKESLDDQIKNTSTKTLDNFAPNCNNPGMFDVSGTKDKEEKCFEDEIAIMGTLKGDKAEALYAKFGTNIAAYKVACKTYQDDVLKSIACEYAIDYVNAVNKQFEAFYDDFEQKIENIAQLKDDIVAKLDYEEGDVLRYVCGSKICLDNLAAACPESEDGLLLPDALNADIFEAVKKNTEVAELIQYDTFGQYSKEDIFDTKIVDYFKKSVREDCDDIINLDIIHAIFAECKAVRQEEMYKGLSDDDEKPAVKLTDDDKLNYLQQLLNTGKSLAAPGIGCLNFNEPRKLELCAYNSTFDSFKWIDIKKTLSKFGLSATSSNTVSKYDIHFFNALYNITPDKLSRFKSPETCAKDGDFSSDSGIYYRAYHEHIKNIGPDSTKSACVSLHIDKRWDSITELPELDLQAQDAEMMNIHSALVYGIIQGLIKTFPASTRFNTGKRIFALEDKNGDTKALTVSNGTECDEFYEVLDSLYRDRASVAAIHKLSDANRVNDEQANHRYDESKFKENIDSFVIGDGHKAPVSLFEIPLMYYNSLPRAKLDDNEITIMVDTIIKTLETEIARFEKADDQDPCLAEELIHQFELLVANYMNDAYDIDGMMRKNTLINDNRVVTVALRKVCNKLEEMNIFQFRDINKRLKNLVADAAEKMKEAQAAEN